jgi:glycosyltransferase involved in cell wall biosynthesis
MATKVLIVTNLFADPFGPGRATFNQQQFGRLSELRGMDVKIIVPVSWVPFIKSPRQYWRLKREAQSRWPQADYVIFWYIPGVARGLHSLFLFLSLALQRFPTLFFKRWDVMLGSWAFPDAVATMMLGRLTGTPVVVKVHGSDVNVFTEDAQRRGQIRWVLNQARAVVSVSKALVARMREIGVRQDHVTVLYNGVDPARFHPVDRAAARAEQGFAMDDELILFIGNILVTKGCGELMTAFCQLAQRRPKARLVLVGDGPMHKQLAAQAKEQGVQDRVHFPGRVAHAKLAPWFSSASVFCLPSWAEGVPNVVLEAMACGTPVVATDVGGIGEILPEFAGFLVPSKDAVTLEATLSKALDATWDRDRTVAYMQPFDWNKNVNALKDILHTAMKGDRS